MGLQIGDDLSLRIGTEAVRVRPHVALRLAEDLVRKAMRAIICEEAHVTLDRPRMPSPRVRRGLR